MKSLSRQSLKLDRKQFARLQSRTDPTLYLILKPNHKVKRTQIFNTLHSSSSTPKDATCGSIRINEFWIGREEGNELICDDLLISSKHVKLICYSQHMEDKLRIWYEIVDNSTNGTLLNGKLMVKGRVVRLLDNAVVKLPTSGADKGRFSFKFVVPKPEKGDDKLVKELFVRSEEEEEKREEEEKFDPVCVENKFNSLNLSIINDTQGKYKRTNIGSLSLKPYHRDREAIGSFMPNMKLMESLKNGISKIVGKISSEIFLTNETLKRLPKETEQVEEIITLHENETSLYKSLLNEMLNDVKDSEKAKWNWLVQRIS